MPGNASSAPRRCGSSAVRTKIRRSCRFRTVSRAARRRVTEVGKRDVAAHLTDSDDRAVRGVALDLALDLFAERMLGDEGDERQRVVHSERGGLCLGSGRRQPASRTHAPRRSFGSSSGLRRFLRRVTGPAGSTTSLIATAIAFVTRFFACTVSRTAWRLRGPRTGWRGLKIHPIPGTGVPPRRRPRSNNQGCSPWNSWNESFESTVRVDLLCYTQQERVATSDGTGRRVDVLAAQRSLLETR